MSLGHDVRFTMRQWSRRPGFAAVAILTLALGIGGATTMYGVLQAFARFGRPTLPEPERVARVFVTAPQDSDGRGPASYGDYRRWLEGVPSFERLAGYTQQTLPLGGASVRVGGTSAEASQSARQVYVEPGYFATLGLSITLGRELEPRDTAGTMAVVNESLAARLWPGRSPVGQTVYVADRGKTDAVTVVGVSRDAVRFGRLAAVQVRGLAFRYSLYRPWPRDAAAGFDVIARTEGDATPLFAPIRQAVEATDPHLRLRHVTSVGSVLDVTEGEQAVIIRLMGASGGMALLLAVIGVFGVMSQLVSERRIEMGVRLALGASPRGLVGLVLRDGLIRIGIGAGLGLTGVFASVRSGLPGLLGASALDPGFWLALVATVATAAAAACYVPARRAAQVDPVQALRAE